MAAGLHGPGLALAQPLSRGRAPSTELPQALRHSRWQLRQLQSMDDAQAVRRPGNPSTYTLELAGDGTARLQLDCNRLRGHWQASSGAATSDGISSGSSGSFRFGPLASTRAACAPGSLEPALQRDLPAVRGYSLQDGQLALSLMADGGLLLWEPLGGFEAQPDGAVEALLQREFSGGDLPVRYVLGRADLNGDGRQEVAVLLMGPRTCGSGGCTLLLLQERKGQLQPLARLPITRLPLLLAKAPASGGWHDLWQHQSGGGAGPSWVRLRFDGRSYRQQERIEGWALPAAPVAVMLGGNPQYSDGVELQRVEP